MAEITLEKLNKVYSDGTHAVRDLDLEIPDGRLIVFVCRSGRRSVRAAAAFNGNGYADCRVLEGGMLAWEAAGLLEAIDTAAP